VIVRWIFALVLFLLVSGTAAAEGGKFIAAPSGSSGGMGRYRVTLAPSVDADAVIPQLLAMCRCRTELFAEAGVAAFMINATPSAARLLTSDRRVALVQEMPSDTRVFDVGGDAAGGERQPQVDPGFVATVHQPGVAPPVPIQTSSAPITANTVDAPWKLGPYTYDGLGNIASIGDDQYSYDAYGRLTAASVRGSSQAYAYDRYANQISRTTGGTITTFGVDTATNRSTIAGMQYDLAGRVTQTPIASFSYDAADMIVESTISGGRSMHLYSASDERIGSIGVSSTNVPTGWSDWTIRDLGGKVLRRYRKKPSGWTWEQDYIYRDGQLIASEIASSSRTRQYHADHLGTPRLVTDDHGMKISSHDYYPFGEEITPPTPERLQFTAHERDHPSLDYMHARYYSPTMGRFLSVDPIIAPYAMQKPQAWNRYSYVLNDPMRFTDPTGLMADCKPETATGEDGKQTTVVRCAKGESSTVTAKRPRFSFFSWPKFSALSSLAANRMESKAPSQTPAQPPDKTQCQQLSALLAAEAQYGTTGAAGRLNNTLGYGLPAFYNDAGGVYRNIQLSNGDELDVDWFVDLQQARGVTGGPVGAAYMFGKSGASVGKAIGGRTSGYMVPFTDPGELTALRYTGEGRGFRDVFTPAYMENACP
jgi:RHS repeat-associated protein